MQTITSREAQSHFGSLLDMIRREPVTIERHGRPVAVVLSPENYDQIKACIQERVSARGFLADLPGFGTEEFLKNKQEEIELEEEKFQRHWSEGGKQ